MNSDVSARIAAARQAVRNRDFTTAETIAGEVLRVAPRHLDAVEIIALAAIERNEHGEAEEALRLAIAIAPERRWPYADLVRLLLKLGRAAEAEGVARAALVADPHNPDAHAMLASMLAEREQWAEAAAHFENAIAVARKHAYLLAGLGRAQMRQGFFNEARQSLETAASADPTALEPAVYLAEVLERLGDLKGAAEWLDRAEVLARRQGTDVDLQRSVLLERMGEHEKALELLKGADLSGAARLQRGRLYERVGKYDDAWADWVAGKAQLAARTGREYRTEEVAARAKRLSAFSAREKSRLRAQRRNDVPQPIFIIGFPRSGTTLTEQILASHSAIRSGGELPFGAELHDLFASRDGEIGPDWPQRLRDTYLARCEKLGLLAPGAAFFTDKMPDNSFWLPLLRTAFPESPTIRLRRHPLDILTSVMAHDMTHGFNCGYRIEDAATHLAVVDRLLEDYSRMGLGPTYELSYEALVADQLGETEQLMRSIGLKLEPAQISFQERSIVSPTPSYAQVREPLNDRSIGRWHHFASQLEPVRPTVAEAIKRGGYAG